MIQNDKWIREQGVRMISPFEEEQVRDYAGEKVISYGTSSFGYDIRLDNTYKVFKNSLSSIIDPKKFDLGIFDEFIGGRCIVPPNSFVLAKSLETFHVPDDVMCICLGKSTYARMGLIINVTPLEPGWIGEITIEISNTTSLPCAVYSNEGIAQVLFFKGERPLTTYSDRDGKYQRQKGVVLPKI